MSNHSTLAWLGLLGSGLALAACQPDPPAEPGPATLTGTTATSPTTTTPGWSVISLDEGDVGLQVQLAADPTGQLQAVYWSNQAFEDGICDEIENAPPTRMRHGLFLAEGSWDAGPWTAEIIDEPEVAFTPTGLSFSHDSAGQPAVAYAGGPPDGTWCGGNDAVLAVRSGGSWGYETAVSESDEAATGESASDAGFVVGIWPGLAYDSTGEPAIFYKDSHFGNLQRDDQYRADAELAWRSGGSWSHIPVDVGEGAQDWGTLLFDAEDRPVAIYAITIEATDESRLGVWAAREETSGKWTRVALHTGATAHAISAATDPVTGEIVVAYYSAEDYGVRVRRLTDAAAFGETASWDNSLVASNQYDEGRSPSLAFASDGRAALAYHRCRRLSDTDGSCDPNNEALVFAIEQDGDWAIETVHEADLGSCADEVSMTIGAADRVHIAFRCTVETDGDFTQQLFLASREL